MALPTTFTPLIKSIEYCILSGSGISYYTIPSGTLSLEWYYENRTQEGLAADNLVKPQYKIKLISFTDANAWLKPNTKTMYDVVIGVDMSYHLDSKILKTKRSQIETSVPNAAVVLQKCLANPNNLLTSSLDGSETGLVSGRLTFKDYGSVKYDYQNSVATATCTFIGKVALSDNTSGA